MIEVGGPNTLEQSIQASGWWSCGGDWCVVGCCVMPIFHALVYQLRLEALVVGSRRMQQDFVRAGTDRFKASN